MKREKFLKATELDVLSSQAYGLSKLIDSSIRLKLQGDKETIDIPVEMRERLRKLFEELREEYLDKFEEL